MHMGNGIICPVTGIPMIALGIGCAYYAYKKAKNDFTKDKILPAVMLTAFVFALQMVNFSFPDFPSSGHIIGGMLLAALLGPYVGFLSICLILTVQALFFADGGLLAIGCNIFNMGILACFVAYPYIYKPLADKNRQYSGIFFASVFALFAGALAVAIETLVSNSISLSSILNFAWLMVSVHLVIGAIEGIASAVLLYCARIFNSNKFSLTLGGFSLILAGFIAQYASNKPDGLEWSLLSVQDISLIQGTLHSAAEFIQTKTSVLLNLPASISNLSGLFAIICLMYLICACINKKRTAN